MGNFKRTIDMRGRRYGRWLVKDRAPGIGWLTDVFWWCLCDPERGGCGGVYKVNGKSLRAGNSSACQSCARRAVVADPVRIAEREAARLFRAAERERILATKRTAVERTEAAVRDAEYIKHRGLVDATPGNRSVRIRFARWLYRVGDPRAQAQAAIARLPNPDCRTPTGQFTWMRAGWRGSGRYATLPEDWFVLLSGGAQLYPDGSPVDAGPYRGMWRDYPDRESAEGNAALAFALLPIERREALVRARYK